MINNDNRAGAEDSSLIEHTVLCVDDEPAILSSLRRLMSRQPYNIVTMDNCPDALDYLEKNEVSLVIVDQRMPEMTGTEMVKEIKKRGHKTMNIILTGYPDDAAILDGIIRGKINRFVLKPWNDKELKKSISELLQNDEAEG